MIINENENVFLPAAITVEQLVEKMNTHTHELEHAFLRFAQLVVRQIQALQRCIALEVPKQQRRTFVGQAAARQVQKSQADTHSPLLDIGRDPPRGVVEPSEVHRQVQRDTRFG